ncbi:Uncharacterized protein Rs2_41025 [Raphanus sativus]|nr:Uncharacterized protein Rs2_41025 [Raphanus sativus]
MVVTDAEGCDISSHGDDVREHRLKEMAEKASGGGGEGEAEQEEKKETEQTTLILGIEQRTDLSIGSTNTSGIYDTIQIPQAPPAGIAASDRYGARIWSRTGDRLPIVSLLTRTQSTRPIFPMQITQAREEVAELRDMVQTLLDKAREEEIINPPPRALNGRAFGTPSFSSAQSGRYVGDNSLNNPYASSIYRNLSYNGPGEYPVGTQGSPSIPLRTRNGLAGRVDGLQNETPPSNPRGFRVQPTPLEEFELPNMGSNKDTRNGGPHFPSAADGIPHMDDQRTDGGNGNFQDYIDKTMPN